MSKNAIANMSGYECFVKDVKDIINQGRQGAYNATNTVIVSTYWNIGKRIVEEEQHGSRRAEYGKEIISVLSKELKKEFGKNYSERNLRYFRRFYSLFPNFEIWNACVPNLFMCKKQILIYAQKITARRNQESPRATSPVRRRPDIKTWPAAACHIRRTAKNA